MSVGDRGTENAHWEQVRVREITALVVLGAMACGDNSALSPDATPGPDATVSQGAEPRSDLIISEISPMGEGPDWIEIHNRSGATIDRCDFFVTDDLDRLDHYLALGGAAPQLPCEPQLIEPGGLLLVYADDDAAAGPEHAPFRLGQADEVHLVDLSGRAVDSLIYLFSSEFSSEGLSLARVPTTTGVFFPAAPTPGELNPEEPGQ